MRGEPAEPLSPVDDPEHLAAQLRQQVSRLKRWVEWELWLYEPRSFAPPEESATEAPRNECGEQVGRRDDPDRD